MEFLIPRVRSTELADLVEQAVAKAFGSERLHAEPLLQVHEVAAQLSVSPDLVRSWVRGGCPCIRAGRKKLRFRMSDVIVWLDATTARKEAV